MRLIDADALKLTHCHECILYPDNCLEKDGGECDWGSIYHIEHCAPTITDVAPVRHGSWIRITKNGYVPQEYICSVCGRIIQYESDITPLLTVTFPFCHCGAKMDGGVQDG